VWFNARDRCICGMANLGLIMKIYMEPKRGFLEIPSEGVIEERFDTRLVDPISLLVRSEGMLLLHTRSSLFCPYKCITKGFLTGAEIWLTIVTHNMELREECKQAFWSEASWGWLHQKH